MKLLLHVCCAPCATVAIEKLKDEYDITLFFYNPNIESIEEYNKRLSELKRYIGERQYSINVIDAGYKEGYFDNLVLDLKDAPEGSKRCFVCYADRITETVKYALENGYEAFDTTLSTSPHKVISYINEIGKELEGKLEIKYLANDFKKSDGFMKSVRISKEYNLYRQNYCGCIYSKKDH